MKAVRELGHKAIFKLEHYPEALFEIENALLNNSWAKKNIIEIQKLKNPHRFEQ